MLPLYLDPGWNGYFNKHTVNRNWAGPSTFVTCKGSAEFAAQSAQPSTPDKEATDLRWKFTRSRFVSRESDESTNFICLWFAALPESMPNDPNKSREVFTE
jgi:hypothetical protein